MENNIKYCPECKSNIQKVDIAPSGDNIYFCKKCQNRFIIDTEY